MFNLGIELWTRDKLEDGYSRSLESSDAAPTASSAAVTAKAPSAGRAPTSQKAAAATETPSATAESFLEAALEKGLTTHAAEALSSKLDGNFAGGIARLAEKDEAWVKSYNEANAPKNSAERW